MEEPGFWLTGIIPAVFTPLKLNGDLDLDPIAGFVEHLIADGANGLYVCGSTGEGALGVKIDNADVLNRIEEKINRIDQIMDGVDSKLGVGL